MKFTDDNKNNTALMIALIVIVGIAAALLVAWLLDVNVVHAYLGMTSQPLVCTTGGINPETGLCF